MVDYGEYNKNTLHGISKQLIKVFLSEANDKEAHNVSFF